MQHAEIVNMELSLTLDGNLATEGIFHSPPLIKKKSLKNRFIYDAVWLDWKKGRFADNRKIDKDCGKVLCGS
jgi:hypothetical protein